jgi:hypothetical protein
MDSKRSEVKEVDGQKEQEGGRRGGESIKGG